MSTSTLPRRRHPLTGAPIAPVGYRKNGRPIMPILGGSQPPGQPPQPAPPAPPQPTPPPAPTPPAAPDRPEGVSEAEWAALGDPGKAALVRERARATAAEQALAAARTAPPAPRPAPPKPADPPKGPDGQPDLAAIVQQAVAAAIQPFQDAQAQREAEAAAATIRDAVTTAAATRFHDATDALTQIDLTTLTDGTGRPDPQKIATALDDLATRKPHLVKVVDGRRQAPPGTPIGGGVVGAAAPLDDRVKASLARMQQATGVKFAAPA